MDTPAPTAYDVLGIHPCAPTELVSTCYWTIVKQLQDRRNGDIEVDRVLHEVTRAYETLSDPVRRGGYNLSIGWTQEPLVTRPLSKSDLRRKKSLFGKKRWSAPADPYEVMGLGPLALPACLPEAHRIMREQYLRLPPESQRRAMLLELLEASYAILSDPDRRAALDVAIASNPPRAVKMTAAEEPTVVVYEGPVDVPQVVIHTQEEPPTPPRPLNGDAPPAAAHDVTPTQVAVEVSEEARVDSHDVAKRPASTAAVAALAGAGRAIAWMASAAWKGACLATLALIAVAAACVGVVTRAWRSITSRVRERRLLQEERRRALQKKKPASVQTTGTVRRVDPNEVFLSRLASTVKDAHPTGAAIPTESRTRS